MIDTEQLRKMIEAQRDEWRIYEENLFHTLISVWNYLSKEKIEHGIEMVVDFYDSQNTIDDQVKDLNMDLLKLGADLTNPIDLIRKQNPDLTGEQAKIMFDKNQSINHSIETEEEVIEEAPKKEEDPNDGDDEPEKRSGSL